MSENDLALSCTIDEKSGLKQANKLCLHFHTQNASKNVSNKCISNSRYASLGSIGILTTIRTNPIC